MSQSREDKRLEYRRLFESENRLLNDTRAYIRSNKEDRRSPTFKRLVQITDAFEGLLQRSVSLTATSDTIERRLMLAKKEHMAENEKQTALAEDLSRVLEERTQFMAMASHDLRNPLSALLSVLQLLEEEKNLSESGRQVLAGGIEAASQVLHLVSTLLDLERLEAGRFEFHREAFSLSEVARQVFHEFQGQALQRKIDFQVDLPDDLMAFADASSIRRILSNLVSNALKYTPAERNVWISAAAADGGSIIEVTDEGPGIPADQQDRVFEKFAQVSPAPEENVLSSGLGLAIARHLAEQMNCRLDLESREGQGCRFRLWVPSPEG